LNASGTVGVHALAIDPTTTPPSLYVGGSFDQYRSASGFTNLLKLSTNDGSVLTGNLVFDDGSGGGAVNALLWYDDHPTHSLFVGGRYSRVVAGSTLSVLGLAKLSVPSDTLYPHTTASAFSTDYNSNGFFLNAPGFPGDVTEVDTLAIGPDLSQLIVGGRFDFMAGTYYNGSDNPFGKSLSNVVDIYASNGNFVSDFSGGVGGIVRAALASGISGAGPRDVFFSGGFTGLMPSPAYSVGAPLAGFAKFFNAGTGFVLDPVSLDIGFSAANTTPELSTMALTTNGIFIGGDIVRYGTTAVSAFVEVDDLNGELAD
jgi:hypothetical protein